jgi:hypothetical protein
MGGYLMLVAQQNRLSVRSQSWNLAISYVEAGVEEGLQHLNKNYLNLATEGWTADGAGGYTMYRSLPPTGSYNVTIFMTNGISSPVIIADAKVNIGSMARGQLSSFFAAVSVNSDPTIVSRAVKVHCYRGGLFTKAMVAKHTINMNGNNIRTDSFDSGDPLYSTNGQYDPAKAKANGDVASNASIENAVNVGNANIYGHVATGPGGTVAVGNNGGVGDFAWQASNPGQIQPGWFSDTSNFTFPNTALPYSSGFAPESGYVVSASSVGSSTATNSPVYPNPPPLTGVVTNTTMVNLAYNPVPPPPGLVTNVSSTTTVTLPNPAPLNVTTNTRSVTGGYPAAGTYVGGVTTNYAGPKIKNYTYLFITGYTYPVYTYSFPTYTFSYLLHATNVVYTTNYYDNILKSGDYYATSLSGKTIVLGDARLVLPNGFEMAGNDTLTIAQNAAVEMFVGGTSTSINGNAVLNMGGLAENFIVYCAPSVTSLALSGNGQFTGVLVAPNAHIDLNGGGNNTVDFIGAMVVSSVKLNGHFNFHYDEALGRMPANGRYLITSWDELYNY